MVDTRKKNADNNSVTSNSSNTEIIATSQEMETVSFNLLFKFIKSFDGNREQLSPFITNCNRAFSIALDSQKPILLDYVQSQLTGKAEAACVNRTFDTWESLSNYLKLMYADKKHQSHLLIDLINCKQQPSEIITDYVQRIETCLKRILASIQSNCQKSSELEGRLAAMHDLALQIFVLYVTPSISTILRARSVETLNDAINIALEEERVQSLIKSQPRSLPNKYCKVCNTKTHNTSDCFKLKKNSNSNSNVHSFQNSNHNNQSNKSNDQSVNNNQFNAKFCKYCKNKGHLIDECFKRQKRNAQAQYSNSETSKNVKQVSQQLATTQETSQSTIVAKQIM